MPPLQSIWLTPEIAASVEGAVYTPPPCAQHLNYLAAFLAGSEVPHLGMVLRGISAHFPYLIVDLPHRLPNERYSHLVTTWQKALQNTTRQRVRFTSENLALSTMLDMLSAFDDIPPSRSIHWLACTPD